MNTILSLQTIPPPKKLIKDLYVLTMDDWKGTLRTLLKSIAIVNYAAKTAFISSFLALKACNEQIQHTDRHFYTAILFNHDNFISYRHWFT